MDENDYKASTDPGQFANLVGVEHEFLERGGVAKNVVWNGEQIAVPLVDVIHLLVAGLEQRQTAQHDGGRRCRSGRARPAEAATRADAGAARCQRDAGRRRSALRRSPAADDTPTTRSPPARQHSSQ